MAQLTFLLFVLLSSVVCGKVVWNQPPLQANEASDNMLLERAVALGVAAPRTFNAPPKSGFNFDSFAADDFFSATFERITEIWIGIGVDQLDSYDIDSVFIGIYPDAGGIPDYDPYSPTSPAAVWSATFPWESNDPTHHYSAPWKQNPVRKGAINVTVDIELQPGVYWLTMHYIISASDVSIPPATWLPGKTQTDGGSPARLFVPGDNPSAGSSNAFGWFWNTLRRQGLQELAFKLEADEAPFTVTTNRPDDGFFYRCAGQNHVEVNVTIDYTDIDANNDSVLLSVEFPIGSPLDVRWMGNDTLSPTNPETTLRIRYFTQGSDYHFTLVFTDEDGNVVYRQPNTVRAVTDPLTDPEWIVRDEYGLIGGLFRWRSTDMVESFEFQIDEDGGDFSMPELSTTLAGSLRSYRPTLADYEPTGNISMFGPRSQGFYVARIRAVNPLCNQTSEWVNLRFQSDECEVLSASFTDGGGYNFKKGKFVTSSFILNEYGTITDLRVRVRGFHQRWSDVGLAVKTPVLKDGHTVDIPLFAEDCDLSWDTHNPNKDVDFFEIFFVIGGNDDSLCPRPPLEGEPANATHVEPWGVNVFEQYVLGKDKRGTWALEWIDYGIGFPTNGKITDYDMLLCTVPVPPREHIVYKGESKVRRGTVAVYGP